MIPHVLVVDDDAAVRYTLRNVLEDAGLTVDEAEDGEVALAKLAEQSFHLVLTDLRMPKLNGLQLLRALREYQPTRQCCFILVTGKGDRAMIEEGKKYGLNNFLAKPFTTATLKAAIEAVVGKLV